MANTLVSMILRVPIRRAATGRTVRLSLGGNGPHLLELASSIHSPYASWLDRFGAFDGAPSSRCCSCCSESAPPSFAHLAQSGL